MMKKCPKCGSEMEPGLLAGAPHWGSGTGIMHKKQTKVIAHLCVQCGYVELWQDGK